MDTITGIFTAHEEWLTDYIRERAEQRGLFQDASARVSDWCRPLQGVATAMEAVARYCEQEGCDFPRADDMDADPIKLFAYDVVRSHRPRKIGLALFVRLLALVREAHLALIDTDFVEAGHKSPARTFVVRFFDRFETVACVDWSRADDLDRLKAAEAKRDALADERERFLTLFESLTKPVFVLDRNWCVDTMNSAAEALFVSQVVPDNLRYALIRSRGRIEVDPTRKVPLDDALPWLAEGMGVSCSLSEGQKDCRFSAVGALPDGEHRFDVVVSSMTSESLGFNGLTLVLDDITFRAEMERQLEDERNRANHYLDVVGSIIVVLDPSGAILRINRAGCEVLGYDESELLGQNWIDIVIPEEVRDEVKDYFYMLFSGDTEIDPTHVNYVTTKDGEHRLVNWNNQLLRNESGMPIGILSSGVDVTEQKAMEEELAEKELWLRSAFVALAEAVLILSPDGEVIDANPAAEPMFGMSNEELTGLHVRDIQVDAAHYEGFNARIQAAVNLGETAEFEFPLRRKNGNTFPAEQSISRITDDNGTLLGSVFALRDISRRKKAEQVLRESEEKFRRIFETIGEGFVVTSMAGTIQMVNPATCRLLGYEARELIGQSMDLLYSDAADRQRLRHELKKSGVVHDMALTATRKDGEAIVVEGNAHIVYNDDGAPIAMEGTFRDITARIEAEKVLRDREKQYRAFFENNHAIMLLEDPKTGQVVDANPAASDFYGYSVDEMRSMNMQQINALDEEAIYKEMFNAREEQRAYFVLRHRLANGEARDVEVYSGPILVGGKQLLYSVIHDITQRIRLEREMKRMATTDALTGANNRHQFFHVARQELHRFNRYGHPLAAIMFDIDYFKSINDTHGHQVGDVVLKALAAMAKKTLRDSDLFGRIGGEEFAVLLPDTSFMSAVRVAERLRENLAGLVIREKDLDIQFTVSAGVTAALENDKTIEAILNRADEALYRAKRMGRNRVEKG